MTKILLALSLTAAGFPLALAAEKPEEALKTLEGTWKVQSFEMGGMQMPAAKAGMDSVVIKGDKLTIMSGGKGVKTFGITVDPSKTPAAMDWINQEIKEAAPLPCIYAVKDGELRLCVPLLPTKDADPKKLPKELLKGPQRPEKFETTDKPLMLIVAKKEKK